VFTENGRRRFRQAATKAELAVKLEPVLKRLAAGAVNTERTGADLIGHYLDPDRLPVDRRWSRKHAHTQARLCERFAAPVIADLACQDITAAHMQQVASNAPTPGEGTRTAGMISALVSAGIDAGYLTNPRLARVHWQAAGRPLPPTRTTVAGESALPESTGGPPTSTATSSSAPTRQPGGATPPEAAPGPGTASATPSAPPPCSPGNSTPPTSPAWPATPATASPSTCTSTLTAGILDRARQATQ
jgi:hypothetical protein